MISAGIEYHISTSHIIHIDTARAKYLESKYVIIHYNEEKESENALNAAPIQSVNHFDKLN